MEEVCLDCAGVDGLHVALSEKTSFFCCLLYFLGYFRSTQAKPTKVGPKTTFGLHVGVFLIKKVCFDDFSGQKNGSKKLRKNRENQ